MRCRQHPHWRSSFVLLLVAFGGTAELHGVSTVQAKRDAQFVDDITVTLAQANARIAAHLAERAIDENADLSAYAERDYELLFEAPCATAPMNANEDWIAYRHERTREFVYRKKDLSVAQDHPPCMLFLMRIQDVKRQEPSQYDAVVEVFDDEVGGYVAIETGAKQHALMRQGETIPLLHNLLEDAAAIVREVDVQEVSWRGDFLREYQFGFASALDNLDGVARRSEYSRPSDDFVTAVKMAKLVDRDPHEPRDLAITDANSIVTAVLAQEERVMASALPTAFHHSWLDHLSLREWLLLRTKSAMEDVQEVSWYWTQLAHEVLVAEKNATTSINCLRRAINWDPGHVPAYLLMSSILMEYKYQNASCQVMEAMLGNLDPVDSQSQQMRTILSTHFSHCNTFIRVAQMWGKHPAVRYIVGAGVVVSIVLGISIMVSCFGGSW